MTLEATIERPTAEPAGMPWPPAGQKARIVAESRVERLTAELGRQEKIMAGATIVAERLRGLAVLVRDSFTDEPAALDREAVVDRAEAAWLVVDCLQMLAERIDMAERHAEVSRREALAEVAR